MDWRALLQTGFLKCMERDRVLDATKYILIILVVLGHFIEPSRYTNSYSISLKDLMLFMR